MKKRLTLLILLTLLLTFLSNPLDGLNESSQVVTRKNRVWSLRLTINYCQITPMYVRTGIWNHEDNSPVNLRLAPKSNFIFQWPWKKDPEIPLENYRTADMISEMSDKIYFLNIIGRFSHDPDKFIHQSYWISPLGLHNTIIPQAPLRQIINGNWNADDDALLRRWFLKNHTWTSKNIWRDIQKLGSKRDARTEVQITIGQSGCVRA